MADASQTVPGDFNALYDDTTRVARGGAPPTLRAAQPAIARMTNEVPNISVHLDEATQNPVQVTVAQGPEVRGATGLTTRAAASPEAAARQFIKDRADLWQLNNDDIATVNVVSVSSTGLPTVRMLQKVDGVEVFQSDMTAAVGADNNLISVSGQLFHGAAGAPHRAEARAAAAPGAGTRRLQHRHCSSGRFGSRMCYSRSAIASSSAAILSNSGLRDCRPSAMSSMPSTRRISCSARICDPASHSSTGCTTPAIRCFVRRTDPRRGRRTPPAGRTVFRQRPFRRHWSPSKACCPTGHGCRQTPHGRVATTASPTPISPAPMRRVETMLTAR